MHIIDSNIDIVQIYFTDGKYSRIGHMPEELEELEKSFIVREDIERKELKSLIEKISTLCKIDANGNVIIQRKGLKIADKILLVTIARFLGNRLQKKLGKEVTIDENVNSKELVTMLREKDAVISARLKDLKDARKIVFVARGTYRAAPYAIDEFLEDLGVENE